jgi:hypothetical protein
MKKRFTDTEKWRDPWFRKLSAEAKLAWQWLLDNCDAAGVIDPDWELAAFQIGKSVSEEAIAELNSKVQTLPDGKLFITKFISFQYKSLSRSCKAHNPVFESVEKNNLIDRLPHTLPEGLWKGSGKGKGKGKGKPFGKPFEEGTGSRPPTLEELKEYATSIPCSEECAVAYQNDRGALNWTKVKSGLQVDIEDWRSDLRTFAMHWRAYEAKRVAEGRSAPVARVIDTRPEKRLKL